MYTVNIFIFLILSLITSFHSVRAQVLYTWFQVAPKNKLSIRTITNDDMCPIFYIDGKKAEMLEFDQ
jgi:hypothetical protein